LRNGCLIRIDANLDQITREIELRDRRDSERKAAPLSIAEDANHCTQMLVAFLVRFAQWLPYQLNQLAYP
jgi:hypothetical protein